MISVKQLKKAFGSFVAVDDLSFDLQKGDIVGFLGPNGAGKSTTMKMLTGFLAPTSGVIEIDGLNVQTQAKKVQQRIGYLPEGAPAYGEMTVYQFLKFIADIRSIKRKQKSEAIADVIEKVELQDVLDKQIETLSKGFKRRVGLAQALIHDPDILVLDEPTDGLDPNQKHQVRQLIRELSAEKIVIISTHILEEVTALCNRAMIIANGQLRFDDTPDALLRQSKTFNAVRLHLSYAADISGIDELEGVADMDIDPKSATVTLYPEQGKSIVHLVSEYVFQRRLPVDQMTVEAGHLDEVFRTLTSEPEDAVPQVEGKQAEEEQAEEVVAQ